MDQPKIDPLSISGNKEINFETHFGFLHKRLYFHQLIKSSKKSRHYIAEDISNLGEPSQPTFYYLKQTLFKNPKEYTHALTYYDKFRNYCKSPFAKSEIAKLLQLEHFEDPDKSHFELVLLFEYGDADRIDVEGIEPEQILRFMKNICLLLNDVFNYNQVTHGNLHLKNIVLCNNELKISGFKPSYNGVIENWKQKTSNAFGSLRLDLFCIGLVWLNFLNIDLSNILQKNKGLVEIELELVSLLPKIKNLRKAELLERLLSPSKWPSVEVDKVLLEFDEYFILEKISLSNRNKKEVNLQRKAFPISNSVVQNDTSSLHSNAHSLDGSNQNRSVKEDDNLFREILNDSDKIPSNEFTHKSLEIVSPLNLTSHFKTNPEFVLNDQFSVIRKEEIDTKLKKSYFSGEKLKEVSKSVFVISENSIKLKPINSNQQFSSHDYSNNSRRPVFPISREELVGREQVQSVPGNNKPGNQNEMNYEMEDRTAKSLSQTNKNLSARNKISSIQSGESLGSRKSKKAFENVNELRISDKLDIGKTKKNVGDQIMPETVQKESNDLSNTIADLKNIKLHSIGQKNEQKVQTKISMQKVQIDQEILPIENKEKESRVTFEFSKKNKAITKINKNESISKKGANEQVTKHSNSNDKKANLGNKIITKRANEPKQADKKTSLLDKIHQKPINKPGHNERESKKSEIDEKLNKKKESEYDHKNNEDVGKFGLNVMIGSLSPFENETQIKMNEDIEHKIEQIESGNNTKEINLRASTQYGKKQSNEKMYMANLNPKLESPKSNNMLVKLFKEKSEIKVNNLGNSNSKLNKMSQDFPEYKSSDLFSMEESKGQILLPRISEQTGLLAEKPKVKDFDKTNSEVPKIKSIGKMFEKKNNQVQIQEKGLSNLSSEVVEKMLAKRRIENLQKLKKENLILEEKKKEESENQPKQNDFDRRIEILIQNSLDQKIYSEVEQTTIQKKLMLEKDNERIFRNRELFERIKRKAEERHLDRKQQEFANYKSKREFLSRVAQLEEAFVENKPKQKVKDNLTSNALPQHRKLQSSRSRTPKMRRDVSENIFTKSKKHDFGLTPIDEVDKQFRFNHLHQVLQIPFRKVVEKFNERMQFEQHSQKRITKAISASAIPKKEQSKILDKFEDTLRRFKEQSFNGINGSVGDSLRPPLVETHSKANFNSSNKLNAFMDDIYLTQKLKSVESESDRQFWSPTKKTFHPESGPNELDLSNVRHINFATDVLPNPVREFKQFTIFKNDQVYIPEQNTDSHKLRDFALLCQIMLNEGKLDQLLEKVQIKTEQVIDSEMIQLNKIIASIFFATENPEKAKQELLNAIENVGEIEDEVLAKKHLGDLIFNLSFVEFLIGDIHDSIEMLKNPIVQKQFDGKLTGIIGNLYMAINKPKQAREFYTNEIKNLLNHEPKLNIIMRCYQLICNILECFRIEKDKMGPAQFFLMIDSKLNKVSTLFKQLDQSTTRPYEGIGEVILMKFLHFGNQSHNFGLMNFVLEKWLKNNSANNISSLVPDYKQQMAEHIIQICNYLKAKPNFGGFEKNFQNYLELAEQLVSDCEVKLETLKLNMMVLFQQGIYLLQQNDNKRAKQRFQKCFDILLRLFGTNDFEVFPLLNQMATVFSKKGDFANAICFYEEFKKFDLKNPEIIEKIELKLAGLFFWNKEYQKSANILQIFLTDNLFSSVRFELNGKIMKWVCLQRIATWFVDPLLFLETQKSIEQKAIFSRDPICLQYCALLNLSDQLINKPESVSDNSKVLKYLEFILKRRSSMSLEKGSEILDFVSVIFSKQSKNQLNILHLLKENKDKSPENISVVAKFIENSLFVVIFALKTGTDFSNSQKRELYNICKSELIRREIVETIINNWDVIQDIEACYVSIKVNELKDKMTSEIQNKNEPKNENDLKIKMELKAVSDQNDPSRNILRRSHFNRVSCTCSEEDAQKFSPTKLIEQFLRQLKNMMYLDVTEDILVYYNRFESIIKEKNWNWHKFSYIPLLFNFYQQSCLNSAGIDQMKLIRILDEVLSHLAVCVHDLKMIVLLLEAFKQPEYLEVLVVYLHRMHPKLATLVFNWIFLENFTSKFDTVIGQLYQKLYSFQFYHFENFPLMHYLNFENVLKIEKNLSFRIYRRYRFDVLANPKFKDIYLQYIESQSLELFYFRFATYKAIVSLYKQPAIPQTEVLRLFQQQMFTHSTKIEIDSAKFKFFIYDFFVVVNFVNLAVFPLAVEFLIQILNHLKRTIPKSFHYHFAVLASNVGNYFFKFKLFKESVKAKTLALESLRGVEEEPADFPEYIASVNLKSLLFGIISFLYFDFIELGEKEQAKTFLVKMMAYDYQNEVLNLEKNLIHSISCLFADEPVKAAELLYKSRNDFDQMSIRTCLSDMFQAAIDKLDALVGEKIDQPEIIEEKRKKSRQSIAKMFKPILKENS